MKRILLQAGIASLVTLSYTSSFAESHKVIYGLENAQIFQGHIKKPIYIQTGNFKEKQKAYRQQHAFISKTKYAVNIVSKGKLYAVLIGPFYSPSEVKKTATSLLTLPHKTLISKIAYLKKQPHTAYKKYEPIVSGSAAKWLVAISGGAQFPMSMSNIAINNGSDFPEPYNKDLYGIETNNSSIFGLSAGRRWQQDNLWMPAYSISLSWQHFFDSSVGSTIMQNSDPSFLNYNYDWQLNADLLLAIAKINLIQYKNWMPYVNGGIGAAFNSATGYNETALSDVTPRISPGFTNNTVTQFTYQIGAGIDYQIHPQVIVSLGYNYQNLGRLSSGPGIGTWSNQALDAGSYSSNEVLVSINYLFEK